MASFSFSRVPVSCPPVQTPYRSIRTPLPVPESLPILAEIEACESRSMHGQMPVVWDHASDFQVFDAWGNVWLDFTSTIFVANAGHANPRIVAAVREMLDHGLVHTYTYPTAIRARFLRALVDATPPQFEKAYLVSSGTEATEMVVKLMRLNGQRLGKRRLGVVSFAGAFHGRTQGAAMIGGTPEGRTWIGFEDPNVHQLPFPYEWSLAPGETGRDRFLAHAKLLEDKGLDPDRDLCGFIFEAYLGWAAALLPAGYAAAAAEYAAAHGMVLAFDEVQGGFGRTGKLFVHQHYGVSPDLIACGKGISSGLPLSAVLGRRELMDLPEVGSLSSTHSANPLVCAAGLANLHEILDRDLCGAAARTGAAMIARLEEMRTRHPDRIARVSGKGMLAALIFRTRDGAPDSLTPSRICECAMRKGLLLVHTGRESIKFGPPLTMPMDAMAEGMDALEACLEEVFAGDAAS